MRLARRASLVAALGLLAACADAPAPTSGALEGAVTVDVAALTLTGVADAVWDLAVDDALGAPVVSVRLAASRYGAGASASYIAPCDARTGGTVGQDGRYTATNTVRLRLRGLYADTLTAPPGAPTDAPPAGSLPFVDPGELSEPALCTESGDTSVRFDVAVARPASQGFFDVAVSFNDVFCSAKYDCGDPAEPRPLLFDVAGQRGRTHVLGVACAAGATGSGAETALFFDDVVVTCAGAAPSTSRVTPLAGDGNLCATPGARDGASAPAGCLGATSLPAAGPLFQASSHKGRGSLPGIDDVYLNVALGLEDTGPAGTTCALAFTVTADDVSDPAIPDGVVAAGQTYPVLEVAIPDLDACVGNHALDVASSGVATAYAASASARAFPRRYPPTGSGPAPDPLAIAPTALTLGAGQTHGFSATGGTTPYTYSVVSGGGSFSGATFTAPLGSAAVVVRVTDDDGATADASVTVTSGWVVEEGLGGDAPNNRELWRAVGSDGTAFVTVTSSAGTIARSTDGLAWEKTRVSRASMNGLAYANGQWVGVGADGLVYRSTDGETWTTQTTPVTVGLNDVAYGSGRWVAVGDSSTILTSVNDGVTWTTVTTGGAIYAYNAVAWNGATWIVVGANNTVLTSATGAGFTAQTAPTGTFYGVAWTGTQWVMVGGSGGIWTAGTAGTGWTARTSGTTALLRAVTYANGVLVVVGASGTIATSPTGATWTLVPSGTGHTLFDVAYNAASASWAVTGQHGTLLSGDATGATWTAANPDAAFYGSAIWAVAASNGTLVVTTNEGIGTRVGSGPWAWRSVAAEATSSALYAVGTDGATWVAVGQNGAIFSSPDALTWTRRTSNTTATLNGVAGSGATFVAVGDSGTLLTSSDGGVTWTTRASGTTRTLHDVVVSGTRWVAAGNNGTVLTTLTPTGTWSASTVGSEHFWDVAASGSQWLVVGANGAVYYSASGTGWTPGASGTSAFLRAAAWAGTRWVAISASPGEILTSANGASWTRQATLGHDLTNVVTDGATVRAVGQVGAMLTSTDAGATWAAEPNPAQDFGRDVAYLADAGRYVVLDNTGYLHSSPDFVTWTTANVGLYQGRSLACSDARCVAVGITGAVITSSDGVTWQTRRLGTTAPVYNGVAWSGSAFMVVGEAGANATSSDGLTWTINAAATSGTLYAVTYGGGSWVAVGASGVVVTSPTGTTWSSRASNTTQHLYAVAASGTACLAVGLNGAVTRGSANGQSWSAQTAPTTAILYGVAWDGTRWVVGGSRGTLLASTDGAAWSAFSPALDLDAVYGVRVVNGLLAAAGTPGSAAAAVLAP